MRYTFILLFCLQALLCVSQEGSIKIPETNEKYAEYVKKLDGGDTNIDYTDFRQSFLDSEQYSLNGQNYSILLQQLYAEASKSNYKEVIRIAKEMLNIDYTSMVAHKYLQQTYKILGDNVNNTKYHDIEFGLLRSIINSGDGKTCETGWHVTQIEEEYFIINMRGDELQKQSITSGGNNTCDKMDVKTEESITKTYYFEVNKVFEKQTKMLKKQ